MSKLRRLLQAVAIAGTLFVGILAVALVVSQTPWFRDWLRRFIVRESRQYVNGDLSIGGLGGNLFFGVQLRDVALDVSGETIVAVKNVELDYSIFRIVSSGMVLDQIKLHGPQLRLERDAKGWNVARLVKKQEKEADRDGPARPLSLPSIEVTDASVTTSDQVVGTSGYRIPQEIRDLDIKASYAYEPVRYTVTLDHASFRSTSPTFVLGQLTGKVSVRDDNVYVDGLRLSTAESSLSVDGVIEHYLETPVFKLTTSGSVSLPEIGRLVPAAAEYPLHPSFNIKANGPADQLGLDLDLRTEAGHIKGQLTADVQGPAMGAQGDLMVTRLDLAPLLRKPEQRSDITGRARFDLEVTASPDTAPVTDRIRGTYTFSGPRVVAAGYRASDVDVKGRIDGPRISLDGRAVAYGGSATVRGFVVTPTTGRRLSFDLSGSARNVDLRDLPATTRAPALETNLSVAEYKIRGAGSSFEGNARLDRSTVEGATIGTGTVAQFSVQPSAISYSAKGEISDLDIQRVGSKLDIEALAKPEYASRVNGAFDVAGSLPRTPPRARRETDSALATMTLTASGTLKNSEIMGGTLGELAFTVNIAGGGLKGTANGSFAGFDPARLTGRDAAQGTVSGTVNANVAVADLTAPITPEAITADGQVTLGESTVGGLRVDTLNLDAAMANAVAEVRTLNVVSPDVKVDAAGRVALDQTSPSNLKYRIEAIDITELARLAGQEGVGGSAILEGTVTGNRASLTTTGTLDGSNLSYQKNNALDLDSTYSVTVPNLEFAQAKVEATTNGQFIKAGGLEITQLTATTRYADKTVQFTTNIKEKTRELDASGSVILHPDHQEVHLPALALRTQGVEWRSADKTEATIKYGNDRIQIENLALVSADQTLNVDGTIALEGEAPTAVLKVQAQNVDLDQLEALLLQDRGLAGRLSANATITGSTAAPTVDGHVEVRNGGFQAYKYESLIADVDYANNRATIDATLTQTPSEQITAKGSVPMSLFRPSTGAGHVEATAADAVDLAITSTAINLGIIQGFTTQIADVQGTLQADVRITGSGQDPHLNGFIDIKNGGFGLPLGGVSYQGINTRIDLTPDVVKLTDFALTDAHGEPLRVSGQLAVHERSIGGVNITITSDNFEVIDNELGDVGVDTNLTITGELRRPKVEGTIRIEAGRLEIDRILTLFYDPYATESLPAVVSAERTVEGAGSAEEATKAALGRAKASAAPPGAAATPPGPQPAGGIFENLEMNVRVLIPDNLVLRGQDIRPGGATGAALGDVNITIGGDIEARKAPGDQVRLIGTVLPIRGTYSFQGRRFDLQREGQLRFTGDAEINPILDVTATRLIPNTGVEARIRVTGTAKAPQLTLTSNPPLEESDILALIVFNRPVNELGTGERSSLAATAGGIATGFIAAPLGESIGRALDLDLFEITTTTENGELGAGVTVGQQIGDRAFFRVRQEFGEQSTSEFMLEYQLASFLRVRTSAAPQTSGSGNRLNQRRVERAGVDLIFFFSY